MGSSNFGGIEMVESKKLLRTGGEKEIQGKRVHFEEESEELSTPIPSDDLEKKELN